MTLPLKRAIRWFGPVLIVGSMLFGLLLAGLSATATPAAANAVTCTRAGNQLTWTTATVDDNKFHIRGWVDNATSKWIGVVQDATTYDLQPADLAKAPADLFFIRYRQNGTRVDVPCTGEPIAPGGNGFCQQNGTTLTWSQESPKNNTFHIRRVNADFSTSWVATVTAANPNTYVVPSADDSYVIRYRKVNALGQTSVLNENCSTVDPPQPPAAAEECSIDSWSFHTDWGWFIVIDGAVAGDSWTLFIDGVQTETASEPEDGNINDTPNVYFDVNHNGSPELTIEVAPTNNLAAKLLCGTIGQDPQPVVTCFADLADTPGFVELRVGPGFAAPFGVEVDGVALDAADIVGHDHDDAFGPLPPAYYEIPAMLTSSIDIVQPASPVNCVGSSADFCTSTNGFLRWLPVPNVWNAEYNVRELNADGTSSWVITRFSPWVSYPGDPDVDYLVRYRIEDANGNLTVFDNDCV